GSSFDGAAGPEAASNPANTTTDPWSSIALLLSWSGSQGILWSAENCHPGRLPLPKEPMQPQGRPRPPTADELGAADPGRSPSRRGGVSSGGRRGPVADAALVPRARDAPWPERWRPRHW